MNEIWELAHFNNGGFTHHEIWELPVTMRRFYLMKTREYLKSIAAAQEKAKNIITDTTKIQDIPKIDVPRHLMPTEKEPTYVARTKKQ